MRSRALDALRGVPWPDAYSFRVLRNRLTHEWAHREADAEKARGRLRAEYDAARQRGDHDIVAAMAGEAVGLIAAPEPVATLIERMTAEALARLARGASADFT